MSTVSSKAEWFTRMLDAYTHHPPEESEKVVNNLVNNLLRIGRIEHY